MSYFSCAYSQPLFPLSTSAADAYRKSAYQLLVETTAYLDHLNKQFCTLKYYMQGFGYSDAMASVFPELWCPD